jgi:hypothetical protein
MVRHLVSSKNRKPFLPLGLRGQEKEWCFQIPEAWNSEEEASKEDQVVLSLGVLGISSLLWQNF